jgi:NAD(P) transhydrogenase subunit beta
VANLINLSYIVAAILFIFGLKMLSSPATARRGNLVSALGMAIAIVVTLLDRQIVTYHWIVIGAVVGALIGAPAGRLVRMTAMPQMVALFNGFGGIASLLVACAEYRKIGALGWDAYLEVATGAAEAPPIFVTIAIFLAMLIGGVTFTGSVVAYAKLDEKIPGRPILFRGQQIVNSLLLLALLAGGALFCLDPLPSHLIFIGGIALAFALGVLSVIPIGGADMPVVIALLNSYSGLAACAAGFIIQNNVLIVSGSLVGASGIVLTSIMCKAMNRSLGNVLFSGFGAISKGPEGVSGEARPISPEDAYRR